METYIQKIIYRGTIEKLRYKGRERRETEGRSQRIYKIGGGDRSLRKKERQTEREGEERREGKYAMSNQDRESKMHFWLFLFNLFGWAKPWKK